MKINFSYDEDFSVLISGIKKKYGEQILEIDGIGTQLDINGFSKKLYSSKNTSEHSVDSNANVSEFIPSTYINEVPKPFLKLNSYYMLWKMMRLLYNSNIANDLIEKQIIGDIYINDVHGICSGQAYSYYGNNVIVLKIDGQPKYYTFNQLFEDYKENINILEDREQIDFSNLNIMALDKNNTYTKLNYAIRHITNKELIKIETKNGFCSIVTSDHPVILENEESISADSITISDSLLLSNSKLPLENNGFSDIDFAYFIGFFLGDGNSTPTGITKSGNYRRGIISIRQNDTEKTKIYKICKKIFKKVSLKKKRQEISIYNRDLAVELKRLGNLSFNKRLPLDILSWKKEAILSLIGGLIDSDGCVNTNGVVDIRVNSFAIIQQVGEIARVLGFDRVRTSLINEYKQNINSFKQNYDMYRISFIPTKEMCLYSTKINKNKVIIFRKKMKDGRWETNKINKLISTKLEKLTQDKYVYDITTESGHFHCNGIIQHNCFNFSALDIMNKGLPFINKIKTVPPKYLYSFKSQIEQFVSYASNSIMGATGVADLLVCMSWYVDKILKTKSDAGFKFASEEDCWNYVRESITSLIYTLNQPFRSGLQSPFSNVSIYDNEFLEDFHLNYEFPDGKKPNKITIKKLQELYIDIINEELKRTPITFPVTTACFALDKDKKIIDKEFLDFISTKNLKYGFINIYCGDSSTLSSCCRLRSKKDNPYFNSFGAGSSKIGSIGVCTVNFPRLAWKCKGNKEEFLKEIKKLVECTVRINNAKRHLIKDKITRGFLPLYSLDFMKLDNQYSTFGINGLYEAIEILGQDIKTEEGQKLVTDILSVVNDELDFYQKKLDSPHNVEQIPGESVSIKLADKDRLLGYNKVYDIYSNQFIPLTINGDMLDRILIQGKFDGGFSGGSILHLNVETEIKDKEKLKSLIEFSANKGVIYFAINYNLQKCLKGHLTIGRGEKCIKCGEKIIDNFTRVVGFLTSVKTWNPKRRELDFPNRAFFKDISFEKKEEVETMVV